MSAYLPIIHILPLFEFYQKTDAYTEWRKFLNRNRSEAGVLKGRNNGIFRQIFRYTLSAKGAYGYKRVWITDTTSQLVSVHFPSHE